MKTEAAYVPSEKISDCLLWGQSELSFLDERQALTECEEIIGALLGVSRPEFYLTDRMGPFQFSQFSKLIEGRKRRIPLAYLLGRAYFWEDSFRVKEGVLIPRPETEGLIENFLKYGGFSRNDSFQFLDLGTGSGVIAITLAKCFPKASGVATDFSEEALEVAEDNVEHLKVSRQIQFIQADTLSAFAPASFDVIFSNPPYISREDLNSLEPEVQKEPLLALDGGETGLNFYTRILNDLSCLKKEGSLWLELGWGQKEPVEALMKEAGFSCLQIFKDLNQIERIISGSGRKGHGQTRH